MFSTLILILAIKLTPEISNKTIFIDSMYMECFYKSSLDTKLSTT